MGGKEALPLNWFLYRKSLYLFLYESCFQYQRLHGETVPVSTAPDETNEQMHTDWPRLERRGDWPEMLNKAVAGGGGRRGAIQGRRADQEPPTEGVGTARPTTASSLGP